ncbi:MAG: TonB-dependent receptor [Bacteroidetes bacterium]|jgi:hypothetical protein|nr:TonB-dependent receptor [Bacteroidota bacterium]
MTPIKALRNLSITILFAMSLMAFGTDTESGRISGKVIDKFSDNPISYATVALISAIDSTIVRGVITNDDGVFEMEKLPYGKYKLQVTYMGYEPKTVDSIELSIKHKNVEMGNMPLHEQMNNLDEVVVEAQRLKGEEKIDRTVYTISDETRKMATDGIDILKQIPSVQVGFQDDITLSGKSNIRFYVDGILRDQEYVAQLDPAMIDKVEVMTNPSVKYGADVAGVINIVLSKEKRFGISGQVGIDIPHPENSIMNPRARIEYGTNKYRVYVSDRLHFERFNGFNELTLHQNFNDADITFTKNGEGISSWSNNNLHYGIDYFLNDKTSINLYGRYRHHQSYDKDFKTLNATYLNDILTQQSTTLSDDISKGNSLYHSLFFKRKFNDEGHELTFDINYYDYQGTDEQGYKDIYADDHVVLREQSTINNRNTTEMKIDYSFVWGAVKQDLGYNSYYQWMNNKHDNLTSEKIAAFSYNEIRQAAYYNLSGNFRKFKWQAGLRGVYADVHSAGQFTSDYWSLLPQASLQTDIKEGQNVKLSYRRSINRPGINDLNPFKNLTDSLHLRYGNPELNPSLLNKFELSYGINFNNNYLSPKLYIDYSENKIQEVSFLNENTGILEFTKANVGRSYEYGTGLDFSVNLTKWWQVNGNLQGFRQTISNDHEFNENDAQSRWAGRSQIYNVFKLPKDFNLFAMFYYNTPTIAYQRVFKRDPLYIIGIEKEVFKNATIELWYVPFMKTFTYAGITTTSHNVRENRAGMIDAHNIFSISFRYRFNHGKKVNKIERSINLDNDGNGGAM